MDLCTDHGDLMSKLTDDLIACRILPLLPPEEVVRTSVLSRRFSRLWRSAPSITLDRRFRLDFVESKLPPLVDDALGRTNQDELLMEEIVDAILASHTGSILSFSVYTLFHNKQKMSEWLQIISKKGVRELSLASGFDYGNVPSSLFSCTQLTSLTLQNFTRVDAPGGCFPRLITLELRKFRASVVDNFVANCPRLEELTLRGGLYSAEGSLGNLRAPNLKRVHVCFSGTKVRGPDKRGLLTPYCPNLTHVTICSHPFVPVSSFRDPRHDFNRIHVHDLVKLLGAWSNIESLCFGRTKLVQSVVDTPVLEKTLHRLKDLTLHRVNFYVLSEVSFLISIVKSSPNLEKLVLIGSEEMKAAEDYQRVMDYLKYEKFTLRKLEMLELRKVCGGPVRLLRFLLENSPSLETIAIEEPQLVRQIQQELNRISSKVKIVNLADLPRVDAVDEHERPR